MKMHFIEQRTPAWDALRKGKLTASCASKIVTPTGKASVQYKGEIARILAEEMGLQEPEFIRPTYWMERGVNLEEEAKNWFQVETDLTVVDVGFIEDESGLIGASPDGLIRIGDGQEVQQFAPLELKCPKPSTHLQWLIDGNVPSEHIAQVHFQIALCESDHGYFCSYNPNVRPLILRVDRSDYTDLMLKGIDNYKSEFAAAKEKVYASA